MPLSSKKELFSRSIQPSEVKKLSSMEAAFEAANSFSDFFKLPSVSSAQPSSGLSGVRSNGSAAHHPRRSAAAASGVPAVQQSARPAAPPTTKSSDDPADSSLNLLRRKGY